MPPKKAMIELYRKRTGESLINDDQAKKIVCSVLALYLCEHSVDQLLVDSKLSEEDKKVVARVAFDIEQKLWDFSSDAPDIF
jgi:hypothetical protein